jgi:hypothetical protein
LPLLAVLAILAARKPWKAAMPPLDWEQEEIVRAMRRELERLLDLIERFERPGQWITALDRDAARQAIRQSYELAP